MSTDSDEPREHLPGWLDLVTWIPALWSRALDWLARWAHDRMSERLDEYPDCEGCDIRQTADEWADKCRALEEALAAEQANRSIAPGTPVMDADLAHASDTPLTGQKARLPQPDINQLVAGMIGPPGKQVETEQEVESRPRPLPPIMRRQHERSAMIHSGCRHVEGKPAITTAAIKARAQEIANARAEAQP